MEDERCDNGKKIANRSLVFVCKYISVCVRLCVYVHAELPLQVF